MFSILCDAAPATAEVSFKDQWGSLLMIVGIFVVFYFFMIRPQQKKQKEIQKMREALGKGDSIVTAGGIHGVIREVNDTYFVVEITKGVSIRVDKGSVYASSEDASNDAANKN